MKPACKHAWPFLATIGRILAWHCSEQEVVASHVMPVQSQGILKCCTNAAKLSRGKSFASSEIGQPACGTVTLLASWRLWADCQAQCPPFLRPSSPANESSLMQKLAGMCYASGPTCTFSERLRLVRRKQRLRWAAGSALASQLPEYRSCTCFSAGQNRQHNTACASAFFGPEMQADIGVGVRF